MVTQVNFQENLHEELVFDFEHKDKPSVDVSDEAANAPDVILGTVRFIYYLILSMNTILYYLIHASH